MGRVLYYISLPFIYLISALPFWATYALSDFLCFILYRIAGYRKSVVFTNLRNSFPEKSEADIQAIASKFYKHLCDIFLETFKMLTISPAALLKRCTMSPTAKKLFDELADNNRNVILAMSHHGTWEWVGNTITLLCRQRVFAIYHPLHNKAFDGLMYQMRARFDTSLITMHDTYRAMVANKKTLSITAFIADQAPSPQGAYWTTFLHQDTPVYRGMERIAKKMDYPVVYLHARKVKRGHYEIDAEMLVAEPKTAADGKIPEAYTRRLERDINAQPETWLWSHRRWKHKRPGQPA